MHQLSGEIFVTGEGEVTIEEPLEKSRMLMTRAHELVFVKFKHKEHHHSCEPHRPDELDWDIVTKHIREQRHVGEHHEEFVRVSEAELYLRIMWRVSSPRTIIWEIKRF